jgi:ribosomal protein L40E
MYCPKCSVENPDEARFCRQCGFQMLGASQSEMPKKPVPTKRVGRFIGAVVLSAMGVLFLLAGLIEGQGSAFVFAIVFLGGAYWLFTK